MERYPQEIAIDIDSFRASGWKSAIQLGEREGYSSMWEGLSSAARSAIEQGQLPEGKSLWLLADLCSMMLHPETPVEPFKPYAVIDGKRSSLPGDFDPAEIRIFAEFVVDVDDPWLRARLADVAWQLLDPRSQKYALEAIDAYRSISIDVETWIRGGRECWARAISLTQMLRGGAGDRLKQIEGAVIVAFRTATNADNYLSLWLAELLEKHRLGREYVQEIAEKLEALGRQCDVEGEVKRAEDYFEASAKWYSKLGQSAKAAEMTVCLAEAYVKEAVARTTSEQPSHMAAATFYEDAIQAYRTIPRRERATHRVEERISELRRHLTEAGEKAVGEMSSISSGKIDISELIVTAIGAVQGKTVQEAFLAFANTDSGANVTSLREFAERTLREHPLQGLFASTHYSSDGRVIAKTPEMGFGDIGSAAYEANVWAQMVKHYSMQIGLVVQGRILPALEVLRIEHRVTRSDFAAITNRAPIVPIDRRALMAQALYAGYGDDFVGAIHILIPQIEHLVRAHLKAANIRTTNLDPEGIENEYGLSTLIDIPEAKQIFGENLAFEIKALFCDALGPNLRNELAHGLLSEAECNSIYAVYAWWLGVRLTINAFWNSMRKMEAGAQPS